MNLTVRLKNVQCLFIRLNMNNPQPANQPITDDYLDFIAPVIDDERDAEIDKVERIMQELQYED